MNKDITIKLIENESELLDGVALKMAHEAECFDRTSNEQVISYGMNYLRENQDHDFFFARKGEKLVGLAHGGAYSGMYHFDTVYVVPEYRKQGIGTSLGNTLIDNAKQKNCFGLTSETIIANEASQKLHEKLGFFANGNTGILVLEKPKGED
jgi:GNAT superfamily N-acetyltransferase